MGFVPILESRKTKFDFKNENKLRKEITRVMYVKTQKFDGKNTTFKLKTTKRN